MKTTNLFGRKPKTTHLKNQLKIGIVILGGLFVAGCASTTVIKSSPGGAKVYLDGKSVGNTPYTYTDKKIIGTTHLFKLEKDGFAPLYGSFSRNAKWNKTAVIIGCISIVPFLWVKEYPADSIYDLRPIITLLEPEKVTVSPVAPKTKAQRLFDLKLQWDAKAITEEEFDLEKKKILKE